MKLIKTRSGRYINAYHAIALALLPAILGIYPTEEEAHQSLEALIKALCEEKNIVHVESHF